MTTLQRFATEKEARQRAYLDSQDGGTFYVIYSPDPDKDRGEKPYCVDDSGFVRSWEKLIATYEGGIEDQ